jgi:tRNA uridine 5-carboxymethylaminomethyl modification enzyme
LVREIDALGGEMGLNIDKTTLQSKMLNTRKGPAVHSLRAQADKTRYHIEMKKVIEETPLLDLKQGEVVDIDIIEGVVKGVTTSTGSYYSCQSVILATGTYLGGKIFIGSSVFESGPNGLSPSKHLTEVLTRNGIEMRRFKTGTPARVSGKTLNYDRMEVQWGDPEVVPFSFMNNTVDFEELPCWLTYTNLETHGVINDNLHRSAMYGGQIEGTGPRYCPSIEDKINRFADKERHQLFIEPEGKETIEMYVQGMSTSMPEDVQLAFMRTIPGMESVEIMRPAYAIEYDCIDPLQLTLGLEFKAISGLFSAGQFNGSSGYEEAAAQGLMAGINAALKVQEKEPFIIDRSEGYIGVLIDDLVIKGTNEPYRMMTSRCEYRLVLRQDNADLRLTEKSYQMRLAKEERYQRLQEKIQQTEIEMSRLKNTNIRSEAVNPILERIGSTPLTHGMSLLDLLRRPEVGYLELAEVYLERPSLREDVYKQCEVQIKYEGYITKQLSQIAKFKQLENRMLSSEIDYHSIDGLRLEARQKLSQIKPASIGQASRISGVSPADISVLLVYIEQNRRKRG